jgi:hypothetical protein
LHENWKKNKKVQILEFGICWPLSVELISENVGNRGNPSTYYLKLSSQSIQMKKNASKLDEE